MFSALNIDQTNAYTAITNCVLTTSPGFFFVSGFGGTGKTFLWKAIISFLRAQNKIVLTVASSGVAALLLPGGRTAHSRFKIPIEINETTICDIKRGSSLANLIRETSLVIWDEALMTHRRCFEALDRSFRDILSLDNPSVATLPFGGKTIVLGGDLRQILPVIEGGSRAQIVDAAIVNSPLWCFVTVLKLTINMRLSTELEQPDQQHRHPLFSKWILDLGDGKLPTTAHEGDYESTWIDVPDDLLIHTDNNKIAAIVDFVYNDLQLSYRDPAYLRERAVLTPTNDMADDINSFVISMSKGDSFEYLSCDSIPTASDTVNESSMFYPVEFLNTICINNFPQHRLFLKEGSPIMLLRNLSQTNGLCNGTRLIIRRLSQHIIESVIITGSHIGDTVYIPRIVLTHKDSKLPFILQRRQFPIRLSYAMTINKSQGQTLAFVGLYLKKPVFTHGQLYVAVSRVTSRNALKILIENDDGTCGSQTRNIVFSEILQCLP